MNKILNAIDSVLSKLSCNDAIISKWKSASVDLTVSSLVNKLGDGSSGWEAVRDEWLNHFDHIPGGFVKLDENTIVQLSQSKEVQDLLWLWCKLIDTSDSDNESNFWLTFNIEGPGCFGLPLGLDQGLIGILVFFVVLFSIGVRCLPSVFSSFFGCGS